MICSHQVHKDYPDVKCVLPRGHDGMHNYTINGNTYSIGGCCPDKQVQDYMKLPPKSETNTEL